MNVIRLTFSVAGIMALLASPAMSQLSGVAGASGAAQAAAAAQAKSQVQQQLQKSVQQAQAQARAQAQAQAQTQVQARAKAQAQAQVQSRLQAEAARAASLAQRVTVAAQNQVSTTVRNQGAAAQQRASAGLNVRLATNTRAAANIGVGNTQANMDAKTYARLGLDSRLRLPADLTQADVQVYDNIFGRFNPLRAAASQESSVSTVGGLSSGTPETFPNDPPEDKSSPSGNPSARLAGASSDLSLTSRIQVAARQRRAQISEVRDRALATADTQLLLKAQRMEDALNAFAQAQTRFQAEAGSKVKQAAQQRPEGAKGRSIKQVDFSATGSATASGSLNAGGSSASPASSGSGGSPAGSVER